MDNNWTKTEPMNEDQLEYAEEQIKQTYLFLIGHTVYDPKVIEALADVQKRYEGGEPW